MVQHQKNLKKIHFFKIFLYWSLGPWGPLGPHGGARGYMVEAGGTWWGHAEAAKQNEEGEGSRGCGASGWSEFLGAYRLWIKALAEKIALHVIGWWERIVWDKTVRKMEEEEGWLLFDELPIWQWFVISANGSFVNWITFINLLVGSPNALPICFVHFKIFLLSLLILFLT